MPDSSLSRRLASEFIGTAMLVCAVVGSGIMAERLSAGNIALALLANTIATGAALFVLILALVSISGAHFNPVVSMSASMRKELPWIEAGLYSVVQIAGGIAGAVVANVMFELPAITEATKVRTGVGQWIGEIVASFGLVGVIIAVSRRHKPLSIALSVAAFITAAYWFTSSTSFANPAVTIARSFTNTFTGIRPVDVPMFFLGQVAGATVGTFVFNWLVPKES